MVPRLALKLGIQNVKEYGGIFFFFLGGGLLGREFLGKQRLNAKFISKNLITIN
jgi:hypothetical protein